MKINKFKLLSILLCSFLAASRTEIQCMDINDTSSPGSSGIKNQKFAEMRNGLKSNAEVFNSTLDKTITVFIGNTGVGKSTLLNLLHGVKLEVDEDGYLIPKPGVESSLKVSSGSRACTKYPVHVFCSEIGDMYDLPGFQDTEGACDDLLNASFIRRILTGAQSVKVLILTSAQELAAARANTFKSLLRAVEMFEKTFRNISCILVINQVEREIIDHGKMNRIFQKLQEDKIDTEDKFIERLYQEGKTHFLPKTRIGDSENFIEDLHQQFVKKILSIPASPVGHLNMSPTFNADTLYTVKAFFRAFMKETLDDIRCESYPEHIDSIKNDISSRRREGPASEVLKSLRTDLWNEFKDTLEAFDEYQLLSPICGNQYIHTLNEFESVFDHEHNAIVQSLVIEEQKEAVAHAEQARWEAEEAAKRAEENAREEQLKAERNEVAKQKAEEAAKNAIKEAEEARSDASKSDDERQQAEEKARLAIEAKQQATKEVEQSKQQLLEAQKVASEKSQEFEKMKEEAHKKSEEMQKAYESRLIAMDAETQRRAQRFTQEVELIRQQLEGDRVKHAEDRNKLEDQLRISQEKHQQIMKELSERQARERISWTNKAGHSSRRKLLPHKEMAEMYNRGDVTLQQVADQFGCSASSVYRAKEKYK